MKLTEIYVDEDTIEEACDNILKNKARDKIILVGTDAMYRKMVTITEEMIELARNLLWPISRKDIHSE